MPNEGSTTFKNVTNGFQSIAIIISLIVGGIWTFTTFVKLAEARKGIAQAQIAEIDAELARRNLANDIIINTSISAKQIGDQSTAKKWVVIDISLKNTGNKSAKLETGQNMMLYVSRVKNVDLDGTVEYGPLKYFQFDYADKIIDWLLLKPNATIEKMHAIQYVEKPGIYLARFKLEIGDTEVGEGHEYGSEVFFIVR